MYVLQHTCKSSEYVLQVCLWGHGYPIYCMDCRTNGLDTLYDNRDQIYTRVVFITHCCAHLIVYLLYNASSSIMCCWFYFFSSDECLFTNDSYFFLMCAKNKNKLSQKDDGYVSLYRITHNRSYRSIAVSEAN